MSQTSEISGASNAEYLASFRAKVARLRVPISGMLELTSRCNLQCVHCYLGPQATQRQARDREMTTAQAIAIIDEMTTAGCLNLVITGGDPMMRKDFPEIYRHAKESGLLVTVFCDGVLVTERILALFDELPPHAVEVSLYGATAATYESITRVKGSHAKCLRGIRRLIEHRIRVSLKTVLMTLNRHEFEEMEALARDLGVSFRFDAAIFPCLPNGDKAPLDLRVTPEEAVAKEMANADRARHWKEYYEQRADLPVPDKLYNCGAGLTGFYIDPFGSLSPCLMTTKYKRSLLGSSFLDGWRGIAPIRNKKPRAGYTCNSCEMRMACTTCPAFSDLETGAEDVKSEYVCATTRLRYNAIRSIPVQVQPVGKPHGN